MRTLFILSALMLFSLRAHAMETKIGVLGGLMQQPTSQYYLAVYGGLIDFNFDKGAFITRLQYFERPKYKSAFHEDQESGYSLQIGKKISGSENSGFVAFMGAGRIQGYVKGISDSNSEKKSSYQIDGLILSLEYMLQTSHFFTSAGHALFSGYVDNQQFDASVLWPYGFFYITLGMRIGS